MFKFDDAIEFFLPAEDAGYEDLVDIPLPQVYVWCEGTVVFFNSQENHPRNFPPEMADAVGQALQEASAYILTKDQS